MYARQLSEGVGIPNFEGVVRAGGEDLLLVRVALEVVDLDGNREFELGGVELRAVGLDGVVDVGAVYISLVEGAKKHGSLGWEKALRLSY